MELETASALLHLGSLADATVPEDIDTNTNNDVLLPVDAPLLEDFSKEMATIDTYQEEHEDSDRTIDYNPVEQPGIDTPQEIASPKRVLSYKNYGIKHHSPKVSGKRKY